MNLPHAVLGRRRLAVLLAVATGALLVAGVSSASAQMFPQCPPVGADTGCQILITVDQNGNGTVTEDPSQPAYELSEDALVGLQNNSAGTVNSVDLTSSLDIFGFDGDGICDVSISPQPTGCPFGSTGYEGPGTSFSNISADTTSGTVNFSPGVGPGGSAYWGLEEAITAADVHISQIAVQGLQCGSVNASATNYQPKRSLTPTVPGVRAFINVSEPSQVTVDASLKFAGASAAKSTKLGTFTLSDPGKKKLRIALPKSLRKELSMGDAVTLILGLKATPNAQPQCASKAQKKNVSLKTRVVHVLKGETQ